MPITVKYKSTNDLVAVIGYSFHVAGREMTYVEGIRHPDIYT